MFEETIQNIEEEGFQNWARKRYFYYSNLEESRINHRANKRHKAEAQHLPQLEDMPTQRRGYRRRSVGTRYGRRRRSLSRRRPMFKRRRRVGWKIKARKEIGERVGTSSTKVWQVENVANEAVDTRELRWGRLTSIPHGSNIDQRNHTTLNLRGIKVDLELMNEATEPLIVHCAWVSPKDGQEVTSADFFRGYHQERGTNFSDALSSLEFRTGKINPDKFAILKHKRFMIGGAPGGTSIDQGNLPSFMTYAVYLPIKRQLRYDSPATAPAIDGNIFMVYWCDKMHLAGGASGTTGALKIKHRHLVYFRESKAV